MKIYISGPDVFRKDAVDHLNKIALLIKEYGHIGLIPLLDDSIKINPEDINSPIHSEIIYNYNIGLMEEADVIIANLEPFRGPDVDSGTAMEIGYGKAKNKLLYGYSRVNNISLKELTIGMAALDFSFPEIEDMGHPVNLMLADGIKKSGGKILNTLEDCLKDLSVLEKEKKDNINKIDITWMDLINLIMGDKIKLINISRLDILGNKNIQNSIMSGLEKFKTEGDDTIKTSNILLSPITDILGDITYDKLIESYHMNFVIIFDNNNNPTAIIHNKDINLSFVTKDLVIVQGKDATITYNKTTEETIIRKKVII